eukprot:884357-Alexandrium_andersonii.AAC.1
MPLMHGAAGGTVSQQVLQTPVVKRSCSWSCHHCVSQGHEVEFQRELERRGVPPLDTSPLLNLPPWYSGKARRDAFQALCFNPD